MLNGFSRNGLYLEITVPAEGLWVWEGVAASQNQRDTISAAAGQYLPGGGIQLFVTSPRRILMPQRWRAMRLPVQRVGPIT